MAGGARICWPGPLLSLDAQKSQAWMLPNSVFRQTQEVPQEALFTARGPSCTLSKGLALGSFLSDGGGQTTRAQGPERSWFWGSVGEVRKQRASMHLPLKY